MGTPGVPFNVPRDRLVESIKRNKGVLMHVAKELGYAQETIFKHVKRNPEYAEILQEARDCWLEHVSDMAEDYLLNNMQQYEDRAAGTKSAMFYLNNQGRKRGYIPPTAVNPQDQASEKSAMEKIADGIAQLRSGQPSKQNIGPDETQTCEKPQEEDLDKSQ